MVSKETLNDDRLTVAVKVQKIMHQTSSVGLTESIQLVGRKENEEINPNIQRFKKRKFKRKNVIDRKNEFYFLDAIKNH